MDFKVIKLKPKSDARKIRHGAPWVYDNEVVLDRRTKKIAPGAVAQVVDNAGTFVAWATVNPASKIFGRVLDLDPEAQIDHDWIKLRVERALNHRLAIFDAPYYRLIHAEADGFPGVIVDRFDDTLVFQPNAAWADQRRMEIATILAECTGAKNVIMNGTGRARHLEGLEDAREALIGEMPQGALHVPMNGATYLADLQGGQKTGLFFDQRPNHAMVQQFAKNADVLDVFSHVGGFGLAAKAAGARSITAVDASQSALDLAVQGAAATTGDASFDVIKSDAFDALQALADDGQFFDVVVCDPPAFAPAKPALQAGLRAYEKIARLASHLVKENGVLVLCSCSHAARPDLFHKANATGIGRAGRKATLFHTGFAGVDHPQHMALAESAYLKSLLYRMQG